MSHLLVLGNAGTDLVCSVPYFPRAGETLMAAAVRRAPGGKGLNQAVAAARAGAAVRFLAPLGQDAEGDRVAAALTKEWMAELQLPRPGPGTDFSVVMVAADAENAILSSGAAADALTPEQATSFAGSGVAGDLLLMQGNLSHSATLAAMRAARQRGLRTMLNPAPLRWDVSALLRHCDIVVANAREAEDITGVSGIAGAIRLREMGPGLSIVTLGAAGCVVAEADGTWAASAPAVVATDTSGAGDAFCGVLAALLLAGLNLGVVVEAAQRIAAYSVQRAGAFASLPDAAVMRTLISRAD